MCEKCDCGRHLCKVSTVIRPKFNKKTSYSQQFVEKSADKSQIIVAKETPVLKGDLLVKKSKYSDEFHETRPNKAHSLKTPDQIKQAGGPSSNITMYSNQFLTHRGVNQYVEF